MKYYFLILGTIVVVCVGCTQVGRRVGERLGDGQQIVDKGQYSAPPAEMLHRPGPMVDGPGPGVLPTFAQMPVRPHVHKTTQVRFINPVGMNVGWKVAGGYAENQVISPGRYNFRQGSAYRLKLTNIPGPGREGLTLYPMLRVYPAQPTTTTYLSNNSVPIEITDEDLDQVESNNLVTKVIYLPNERYQQLAVAGVETLVSTTLEPGVDPVAEADRRGTIMAVLTMGNVDLEMPNSGKQVAGKDGQIKQVSHVTIDGAAGQYEPPQPVAGVGSGSQSLSVPDPMIAATYGVPGGPAYSPVSGVGGVQPWGHPITATPIGLPGPPHMPYGRPAGLKSHTMRNLTKVDIGEPVDHLLIDVDHKPGIRMPHPVRHIQYSEEHPVYQPGEVSYPAWSLSPGVGASSVPTP